MRALASHRGGKTQSISPSPPARWGSPTTLPRIKTTCCSNRCAREGTIPASPKLNVDKALVSQSVVDEVTSHRAAVGRDLAGRRW